MSWLWEKPGVRRAGVGDLVLILLAVSVILSGCGKEESGKTRKPLIIWGSPGLQDGEFSSPRDVVGDGKGNIYVVDMTGRIQKFTSGGEFLLSWEVPEYGKGFPRGLGVDGEGNVLVGSTHYGEILRFSPDGRLLLRWGKLGKGKGEFNLLRDVAVDKAGNIYASDYGAEDRIQKFDAGGQYLLEWGKHGPGPGEFKRPEGIAVDSKGCVYVADSCNHRIQKFTSQGEFLLEWGVLGGEKGNFKYPYDVAVDPQDNVYVCEYGNHRLQKFTSGGEFLDMWGSPGREEGEFSSPWGIAVGAGGDIYVADTENHRIQRFGSE